MFYGFGVIANDTILQAGREYTITYASKDWWQPSEEDVTNNFRQRLLDATVIRVNRPLFSGRYAVTMVPASNHPLSYWLDVFKSIWYDTGYPDAEYVSVDEGETSSQGGGATQLVTETVDTATSATGKIVSSAANVAGRAVGAAFKGATSGLGTPLVIGIIGIGAVYLYISTQGIPRFGKNPRRYRRRRRQRR